jgi:hypothetical protein
VATFSLIAPASVAVLSESPESEPATLRALHAAAQVLLSLALPLSSSVSPCVASGCRSSRQWSRAR